MGAANVLAKLSALGVRLIREGQAIRAIPRSALTDEARALIRQHKAELLESLNVQEPVDALPDSAAEARRRSVLTQLARCPTAKYALVADTDADPEAVILALAIRDVAVCELRIPREKYDPFLLLDLIERHAGVKH